MYRHDNKELESNFTKQFVKMTQPVRVAFRSESVQNFADWVEETPTVKQNLVNMVIQHSLKADSTFELGSYLDFFKCLDEIIAASPQFGRTLARACPFYSLLWDFRLCSEAVELFRNQGVNEHFKHVLKEWCVLLSSPRSLDCLHTGPTGFLSPEADRQMDFSQYEMDMTLPHAGFRSFNEFFARAVKPELRPIASPDDDSVVVSPCDSRPDQVSQNIYETSFFWIKKGLYSLKELLGSSEHKEAFVGGTAIQAYLNPFDYHGWHAPVTGTVIEIQQLEGFYFPLPDVMTGNTDTLWYLSHLNARAIIIIQADHEPLGKVALINVGMGEVSSCLIYPEITVGKRIKKGEKIGTFQFGGSTYCLLFEPGAIAEVTLKEEEDNTGFKKLKMGQKIARGAPKS